jgi:hypothetical protein
MKINKIPNTTIASVQAQKEVLLGSGDQVPVLLADVRMMTGCKDIILDAGALSPAFFDLSTGVAGDILQKFVNYRVRLAIIYDSSKKLSENMQAFIRESNRGNAVFFVKDEKEAVAKLSGVR